MPDGKKCVIGYKKMYWENGSTFGYKPDWERTTLCCDAFAQVYTSRFSTNPDDIFESRPGIKLLMRGDLKLLLNGRIEVKRCPSCGAEVEVKQTSEVTLKEKKKLVHDGYEELPFPLNAGALG